MAHFIPTGMRTKIQDPTGWIVNTCANNDTAEIGDDTRWAWANPTSRITTHEYAGIQAVSTECLWQGTKIRAEGERPDEAILQGEWRKGKGRRPIGAWAGEGQPLITNPGAARRAIYIPAFRHQIETWLQNPQVADLVERAKHTMRTIYLRDHDTGQGLDRNGPMSHAWVLSEFLNNGTWPS